jgi:hypothetical protein
MVTMIDEIYDRAYRDARGHLNASVSNAFSRFGRTIGESFRVLHRIEWSAPWNASEKHARRG